MNILGTFHYRIVLYISVSISSHLKEWHFLGKQVISQKVKNFPTIIIMFVIPISNKKFVVYYWQCFQKLIFEFGRNFFFVHSVIMKNLFLILFFMFCVQPFLKSFILIVNQFFSIKILPTFFVLWYPFGSSSAAFSMLNTILFILFAVRFSVYRKLSNCLF